MCFFFSSFFFMPYGVRILFKKRESERKKIVFVVKSEKRWVCVSKLVCTMGGKAVRWGALWNITFRVHFFSLIATFFCILILIFEGPSNNILCLCFHWLFLVSWFFWASWGGIAQFGLTGWHGWTCLTCLTVVQSVL